MHAYKRRARVKGTGGGGSDKAVVIGLLEKHGEVRATVIERCRRRDLHPVVYQHVELVTELHTDMAAGYRGINRDFVHKVIDHAEAYVKDNVSTNGLENFWSLFKRCIKGTHINVEPFHLFRYVDAEVFRFNNRKLNDAGRFGKAVDGIGGKRLTYFRLTGKDRRLPPSGDTNGKDAGSAELN